MTPRPRGFLAIFCIPARHADKFRVGSEFMHEHRGMRVTASETTEDGGAKITAVEISDTEARPGGLTIFTVAENDARGMKLGDVIDRNGARLVVAEIGATRTDRTGSVVDVMGMPVQSPGRDKPGSAA